MITPDQIAAKSARAYLPYLRTWLRGEPFIPLDIPAGTPPGDFRVLEQSVAELLENSKERRGYGYIVEIHTRTMRAYGSQSLPVRIRIMSAEDMLQLAGKASEFARFVQDVVLIRTTLPELEVWLEHNPQRVIEHHGAWPELLRVCVYFRANPRPAMYIRELPIAVHTKFIEQHTGILTHLFDALLPTDAVQVDEKQFERRYGLRFDMPLIRIRLLDPPLQTRLGLPFSNIAAPTLELAKLPCAGLRCIIVENKMVFLTMPPLPGTITIFGGGFQVELLRELPWLHDCPIWYWGDLDAQGLQILARLRALFPQTVSLMMDAETIEAFRRFAVVGTPCPVTELRHLLPDEQTLFANLARANMRLEQERISYSYALQHMQAL